MIWLLTGLALFLLFGVAVWKLSEWVAEFVDSLKGNYL